MYTIIVAVIAIINTTIKRVNHGFFQNDCFSALGFSNGLEHKYFYFLFLLHNYLPILLRNN